MEALRQDMETGGMANGLVSSCVYSTTKEGNLRECSNHRGLPQALGRLDGKAL